MTKTIDTRIEQFSKALGAAVEACLWSTIPSIEDDGAQIAENADEYWASPETLTKVRGTIAYYMKGWFLENYESIEKAAEKLGGWEMIGHDFWLTSQGHGAGFWDRGLGDLGDKLTDTVQGFEGILGLYVESDDKGNEELKIDPYNVLDFNDQLYT